jgi:hypothetical protein
MKGSISKSTVDESYNESSAKKGPRTGCGICNAVGHCICYDDDSIWISFKIGRLERVLPDTC